MLQLTPIGLTVYQQITATDADQSNNGQITYSLLAGDGTTVSNVCLICRTKPHKKILFAYT